MRQALWIVLCSALILMLAYPRAQASPRVYRQHLSNDFSQQYIVQLPSGYDRHKKYPLFIAVPWTAGNADQQYAQWYQHANRDQYILLCPGLKYGYQWFEWHEDEILLQMMRELYRRFPYDRQQVYLVGASAGAEFTHRFAFKYPHVLRAAGVFAAEKYIRPPGTDRARRVRFFIGIGDKDQTRMAPTLWFYEQLKKKGFDVTLQIFPDTVHGLDVDMKKAFMEYLIHSKD